MEKARIMVVEDEKLVALAIEKSLKNMGYDVPLTVATGEEAVSKVLEIEPDLVLMDIRLQGKIDGVEAASRIQSAFHTPIIYLTAYSGEKILERAKHTEPFGYILKPFEERTLQATVEMALYKATMEKKLWRTKEKLETILRCFAEGVVVAKADGVVEYLNPMADKILLPTENLVPGTTLAQIFETLDADTFEPVVLPIDKVTASGEVVEMSNLILMSKAKGRLYVDYFLAPLRNEVGKVQGMILAFRDMTERKKIRDIVTKGLHEALELQRSLLPRDEIPIAGFNLRWLFRPSAFAAGDLFNAFPIDGRYVSIYMIDVAGSGIASAVNSQLLQRFLSQDPARERLLAFLDADPLEPKVVLEKLQARFSAGSKAPFFALLYGSIDTATGAVTFVRFGQPYPMWQKGDGTVRVLRLEDGTSDSTSHPEFTEHKIHMEKGDRLYIYSYGLIECANPEMEQFSESRLQALVAGTRSLNLEEAVSTIGNEIQKWRGSGDFDDDVCLMAMEKV